MGDGVWEWDGIGWESEVDNDNGSRSILILISHI
jgi:hypothetical protein